MHYRHIDPPPKEPSKTLVYAALLSVALVNTGYNVLTKHVLSPPTAAPSGAGGGDSSWTNASSWQPASPPPPPPPHTKADPLIFSMLRDCAAWPILHLGAFAVDGWVWPKTKDILMISIFGLTGMFGNQFLFIYGLAGPKIPTTEASVLSMTQPIFAAVLAVVMKQQKLTGILALGVALTFGGSIIMAKVWTVHHVLSNNAIRLGSLLLGAFSMAVYYIIQKPYLEIYPVLSLTAWSYFFGAMWMVLAQFYYLAEDTPEKYHARYESINNTAALLTLLFAVLMNSVSKYALQSFSNKWTNATTLTVWSSLVPIFTAIVGMCGIPGFKEKADWSYLGGVPVIAGVMLVTMAKEREKKEAKGASERLLFSPTMQ